MDEPVLDLDIDETEALKAALRFYASPEHWEPRLLTPEELAELDGPSAIEVGGQEVAFEAYEAPRAHVDNGTLARQVLGMPEPERRCPGCGELIEDHDIDDG